MVFYFCFIIIFLQIFKLKHKVKEHYPIRIHRSSLYPFVTFFPDHPIQKTKKSEDERANTRWTEGLHV